MTKLFGTIILSVYAPFYFPLQAMSETPTNASACEDVLWTGPLANQVQELASRVAEVANELNTKQALLETPGNTVSLKASDGQLADYKNKLDIFMEEIRLLRESYKQFGEDRVRKDLPALRARIDSELYRIKGDLVEVPYGPAPAAATKAAPPPMPWWGGWWPIDKDP